MDFGIHFKIYLDKKPVIYSKTIIGKYLLMTFYVISESEWCN